DLKPANVLVTEVDGQSLPKIIDFGIARATGLDQPGQAGGTPNYISPEQAGGSELDPRSDVFALAAMLRELLSGQRLRPWVDDTSLSTAQIFARIAAESAVDAVPPLDLPLPRSRSHELDAILRRALASDPAERYEDAHALADDLQRWLSHQPVQALPATLAYRWRCALRRHRLAAAVVALVLLLVLGFSWQLHAQYRQTQTERDTAEQMVAVLLDTFTAADPVEFPGGSVSARALLSGAAERIQRRNLTPQTRVRVLSALGGVQQNLELYDDARQSIQLALQDAENVPEAQRDALELLLSRIDMDAGEFDRANEALQVLLQRHGDLRDALWLEAELQRADLALLQGDPALAGQLLESTRLPARQSDRPDLRRDWHLQQARLATELGDNAAALEDYRAALSESERLWGAEDLRTLTVLNDLAVVTSRAGQHEQAIELLQRVATLTEAAWGSDSAGLATVYGNIGATWMRANRPDEAEHWHRRAANIFEKRLGEASLHTGTEYNNLAAALEAQGRATEALPWFDRALDSLSQALGADHLRVGVTLHNQAKARLALGEVDQAEALLARSGDILRPILGEDHPRWQVWRVTRAQADLQSGRVATALAVLSELLPALEQSLGPEQRDSQRARRLLAWAQAAQGECEQSRLTLALLGDADRRSVQTRIDALCGS
ncbi:MAG: tetratricopeptide repeat protein, partial [Xanthomonadales bacterium]|nr:tetratricopeptide repeat protein [Xanthomonadales bacterium]